MNEQQLQQILINAQQAIAAAATAAVINSLLNPQQAGNNLLNANNPTDPSNDLQQQQIDSRQQSPVATSSPANPLDGTNGIQELLLRLQQQAAVAGGGVGGIGGMGGMGGNGGISQATAAALNLNLNNQLTLQPNHGGSPISQSPVSSRLLSQQSSSNNIQQSNQITPNKKLKRHHQSPAQPFPQQNNRSSLEPTSKPQHSTPKSNSLASLGNRNNNNNNNNSSNTNNSSSSSSSAFLTNNVGLPRKLVRGQDVWLGRGAEQTRQILKCMWCGQSFRTLAEMTQHMKVTQHYTNIISQEQITSWRQPESSEINHKTNKQSSHHARSLDDNHDDLSDRLNDSDRDDSFSNDDEIQLPPQQQQQQRSTKSRGRTSTAIKRELTPAQDNLSTTGSNKDETSPTRLSKELSQQQSSTLKPHTRSRRRENEEENEASNPATENASGRENSPASESSSSQQRLNISVLGDHNEDSETNKEIGQATDENSREASPQKVSQNSDNEQSNEIDNELRSSTEDEKCSLEQDDNNEINGDHAKEQEQEEDDDLIKEDELSNDKDDGHVDERDENDADEETSTSDNERRENQNNKDDTTHKQDQDNSDKVSKKRPKRKEPEPIVTSTQPTAPQSSDVNGPKGPNSGDPLSALETMVEKEFDPRVRPGVANGGILQRLGIDEEVCPPWQHINYANWYAAAAYGHPMAAALLAAGINLNGIKMSKNVTPKKEDD